MQENLASLRLVCQTDFKVNSNTKGFFVFANPQELEERVRLEKQLELDIDVSPPRKITKIMKLDHE